MSKGRNNIMIVLAFLLILCACKENKQPVQDNKPVARDVLLNKTAYKVDSIALEYTDIDSVTQFVKRIFYHNTFNKPDTIKYKLINGKTKAYLEYPHKKIRSLYLDTETTNIIMRNFKDFTQDTVPPPPTLYLHGRLQYINYRNDSIDGISYYVFRGNDVAFSWNMDGYFFFDSIFHLKRIYNDEGVLMFSAN